MANNMMFLHHKGTGKKLKIAKFYPSLKWFACQNEDEITAWLQEVCDATPDADEMYGPTDFELKFEETNDESQKIPQEWYEQFAKERKQMGFTALKDDQDGGA